MYKGRELLLFKHYIQRNSDIYIVNVHRKIDDIYTHTYMHI